MRESLFCKYQVHSVIAAEKNSLINEIDKFDQNYILNTSLSDIADFLKNKYEFEVPILDEINKSIVGNEEIDQEINDYGRLIRRKLQRITVKIPFNGNSFIFDVQPSSFTLQKYSGKISGQNLYITLGTFNNNPNEINQKLEEALNDTKRCLKTLISDFKLYNLTLEGLISAELDKRHQRALKNINMLSFLNIPVNLENSPLVYKPIDLSVRKILPKPRETTSVFNPEPAISEEDYNKILQSLESMVINMERSPQLFHDLKEETLRDFLLLQLNVLCSGNATGETFNKKGKTDILIRYNEKNIFIAECKIWSGSKKFEEAIEQLLGYTCWRDTKIALLVFNKKVKDHSLVIRQIQEMIENHNCFKKLVSKNEDGGFRFLLHQPGDRNRELHLSTFVFHVPDPF